MNGPNPYLADIYAAFNAGANANGITPPSPPPPPPPGAAGPPAPPAEPFGAGAQAAGLAPITFAPDPETYLPFMGANTSVPGPPISVPGIPSPPPAPPPAPLPAPPPAPPLQGPPGVPAPPPMPMAADGPGAPPFAPPGALQVGAVGGIAGMTSEPEPFPIVSVPGGGTIPAHEREMRGPTFLGAQATANQSNEQTIHSIAARNAATANDEYNLALEHERAARAREQAIQQSAIEADEELSQRQQDFDSTVRQMGRLGQIDRGRLWASRSTGQKIAGFIELAASGMRGTPSMLMKQIDDDVRTQEFAFNASRDIANAKQTAFSMAMQKYQNAGAARAMARAAGIDVAQTQLAQLAANARGSDAANNADIAHAHLGDLKADQVRQGIQYIPAQSRGPTFIDRDTGLPYDLAGAHKVAEAWRANNNARAMKVADVGGSLTVEDAKAQHDLAKENVKSAGHFVTIPFTGETVKAPSEAEAQKLRELVATTAETGRLVKEAKEIRAHATLGVPYTQHARARLNQIQAELLTHFGVQHQLGALSDKDYDIAQKGTAELFNFGSGVEARLDRLNEQAAAQLRTRVGTYPGASESAPRASGQMPPEFVPMRGQK